VRFNEKITEQEGLVDHSHLSFNTVKYAYIDKHTKTYKKILTQFKYR